MALKQSVCSRGALQGALRVRAVRMCLGTTCLVALLLLLASRLASTRAPELTEFEKSSNFFPLAPESHAMPKYQPWSQSSVQQHCGVSHSSALSTDVQVLVLTHRRIASVRRLIRSLKDTSTSHTGRLHLRVCVDVPPGSHTKPNPQLMQYLETVRWTRGQFEIGVQKQHAGLTGQWVGCHGGPRLRAWPTAGGGGLGGASLPSTGPRAAVLAILEDDMQVSPQWLHFVLGAHAAYAEHPHIVSYALQRPQIDAVTGGRLALDRYVGSTVLAYRLLGTWGFIVQMDVWQSFTQWQAAASGTRYTPGVPGLAMTQWYQGLGREGRGGSMWEMWWIDYAEHNDLLTVFGNPGGTLAWGANWMEAGEHYGGEGGAMADSELVQMVRPEQVQFPAQPVVLDWTATPMVRAVPFGRSASLEQDSARGAVCALQQAGAATQSTPFLAIVTKGTLSAAMAWAEHVASASDRARTVFVAEDAGTLGGLRQGAFTGAAAAVGHDVAGGGAAARLRWLARVAAAGAPRFVLFDVEAAAGKRSSPGDLASLASATGGAKGGGVVLGSAQGDVTALREMVVLPGEAAVAQLWKAAGEALDGLTA